jgi:hypothetical protein
LPHEFARRSKNEDKRLGLISALHARFGTRSLELEGFAEELGKDRDEEGRRFAGAYSG